MKSDTPKKQYVGGGFRTGSFALTHSLRTHHHLATEIT